MKPVLRVLLVDDDSGIRNALKTILQRGLREYRFVDFLELDTGTSVLDSVKCCVPDLVLLDVMMPDVNGMQVLAEIRKCPDPLVRKVPVIMLTGIDNGDIADRCRQLGATDYITKPWDADARILLLKVRRALKGFEGKHGIAAITKPDD